MSTGLSNTPALRLVSDHRCGAATSLTERNTGPLAGPEALKASDARWVFTVRVAVAIEGERAAVLTPEKRDRLLRIAAVLGLRPFDANLIIAIVQDSVRCGLDPLGQATSERVAMIRDPATVLRDESWAWFIKATWVSALGAAGALFLVKLFGG